MLRRALLCALVALAVVGAGGTAAGAVERQTRIVGGLPVTAGSHPWQVALEIRRPDAGGSLCGGTLVAPTKVLTAAHCTHGAGTVVAEIGSTTRGAGERIAGTGWTSPASARGAASPPRWDVSMLTLARAPRVAEPVQVVAAEGGAEDVLWAPARSLVATGWGLTEAGSLAVDLRRAVVGRLPDGTCRDEWFGAFASTDMLCAEGASADTCSGDSGGPLLAPTTGLRYDRDPAAWRLVGVTSWGSEPCRRGPGVYARLAAAELNRFAAQPRTGTPPRATTAPVVTGEPRVGAGIGCAPGTWTGDAGTLTESLYRVTAAGDPVRVATAGDVAHTVADADVGARFVCLVSARGAAGQAAAESPLSGPVTATIPTPPAPAPAVPVVAAPPPAPPRSAPPRSAPARSAPDRRAPRVRRVGAACARRRCTIRLRTSERVARVVVRAARCGGRRCARSRPLTVRAGLRSRAVVVRTGRLPRGRHRVVLVAVDAAGNRSPALVARLRVR